MALRSLDGIVVILVQTDGSENAGSVARLCGNFGCALRFVDVRAVLDGHDARKMANPCVALLDDAPRFATLAEAIADCTLVLATSGKIGAAIDHDPVDVARVSAFVPAAGERTAVVFGNERTGLSLVDADRCHRVIRLATPGPADSFNLASAVAVTLTLFAEASRDPAASRAPHASRLALRETFETALQASGFYKGRGPEGFRPRLDEILGKMDLSVRDIAIVGELVASISRASSSSSSPP